MLIYANNNTPPNLSQTVNSLGKYIYKHLDGAINYKKSSNMFDIYSIVLYSIPHDLIKKYGISEDKYKETYEMIININITTYQEKIRVNLIEESPDKITLGSKIFNLEKLRRKYTNQQEYFNYIKEAVVSYLIKRLELRYQDYDFIY